MTTYPGTDKRKENENTETADENLEKLIRVRDTIVFQKKKNLSTKKNKNQFWNGLILRIRRKFFSFCQDAEAGVRFCMKLIGSRLQMKKQWKNDPDELMWREGIKPMDIVDARDSYGEWRMAQVMAINYDPILLLCAFHEADLRSMEWINR